ncbi:uncharacterized protein LOC100207024 isoform X1 [Hydra vulgaris]|uniref:uncharacterized protein LOC100207024 isoform X1 n=1 Tax=Hydra vulgaris TaxID=6087 RepID=UPI001F5E6E3C|nr:uncharacterized protein LOC100207024 [Hydra vulgaris]
MADSSGSDEGNNNYCYPTNIHIFDFKYKRDESLDNLYACISNELITYLSDNKNETKQSSLYNSENTGNIIVAHKVLEIKDKVKCSVLNKKYVFVLKCNGKCSRIPFLKISEEKKYFKYPLCSDSDFEASSSKESSEKVFNIKNENISQKYIFSLDPNPSTIHTEEFAEEVFQQIPTTNGGDCMSYIQSNRTFLPFSDNIQTAPNYNSPRYIPYMQRNIHRSNQIQSSNARGNIIHIPNSTNSIFYDSEESSELNPFHIINSCSSNMQEIPINLVVNNTFPFELTSEPLSRNNIDSTIIQDQNDFFSSNNMAQLPQIVLEEPQISNSSMLDCLTYETDESNTEKEKPQNFELQGDDFNDKKSQSKLFDKHLGSEVISCQNLKVQSIYAMESGFILLDSDGVVWFLNNNEELPVKLEYEWNGLNDKVVLIGCSGYRMTLLLASNKLVTLHDYSFQYVNKGAWPSLIRILTHEPVAFDELQLETIIDIKCSFFHTVVHTLSGKVFWWGLAPSNERHDQKCIKQTKSCKKDLKVGDTVMLEKSEKVEKDALVFNHKLMKFGVVVPNTSNEEDKLYDVSRRHIRVIDLEAKPVLKCKEHMYIDIWDVKNIVFLEESNTFTGKVISFDGPYAIVQMKEESSDLIYPNETLKVCLKTSLEKLNDDAIISQSRYRKYLYFKPIQIFLDKKYTVSAISCSEAGITSLFVRLNDDHAFLSTPNCENTHSNWFTSGITDVLKSKNAKNCTTVEFESVDANNANLCMKNITSKKLEFKTNQEACKLDLSIDYTGVLLEAKTYQELESLLENQESVPKISRSLSMPVTSMKRKFVSEKANHFYSKKIMKPNIYSLVGGASGIISLLFDNKGCFYPTRFDCCLREPPLFEMGPIISFALFEESLFVNDESLVTIVVVVKENVLVKAIKTGDKNVVCNLLNDDGWKRKKMDENFISVTSKNISFNDMLDEYCSGNQNIMHISASNILKTKSSSSVPGNIMDVRSEEENFVLQKILENMEFWDKVKDLLCQRDTHGCTPFLRAIVSHNLHGAYMILEAVKKNNKKKTFGQDNTLLEKAILMPSSSGLTPVHCLVHSSSKKPYSQQWFNTLKVSNLPQNYSSRLLLKLFKSHFPSVYRAMMPIPKPYWTQQSVRDKLKERKSVQEEFVSKKLPSSSPLIRPPVFRASITPGLSYRATRYHPNQADVIRANAKEGLVMFGDLNEMFQALAEMNNYALLSKTTHPSGALLSVCQHMLQVQQYQENAQSDKDEQIPISAAGSSSPRPLLELRRKLTAMHNMNTQKLINEPNHREETISKCFDDIMVHLLLTSLIDADPMIALKSNKEGESAFSYFIKTYPRYSPSHLHKLFLNWRPCNSQSCKYMRHVGKLTITPQTFSDSNTIKKTEENLCKKDSEDEQQIFNPILARRGLQSRTSSLKINVDSSSSSNDTFLCSPSTPGIKLLENLKYGPIELAATTGLTPQSSRKSAASNPFFSSSGSETNSNFSQPKKTDGLCTCHLNKARLLWNTTFEASHFLLSKNWPSIVSTILWNWNYDHQDIVSSNKLDTFTSNLLIIPYSILLEVLVKTLIEEFSSSPISKNVPLLLSLQSMNPTDNFSEKAFNALVPWLTVQRFVRSIVRQLSLYLSKNTMSETNLKYKIGRYANKNHFKKETRMKDNLCLCLRAFSWISINEILKAAISMLKPIQNGTVKAQAKGIIHDQHQLSGRTTLGNTNLQMHVSSRMSLSSRPVVIRCATRNTGVNNCFVPPPTNMLPYNDSEMLSSSPILEEDNSSSEENVDDPFPPLNSNNNLELNEVEWLQAPGTSGPNSINWAVDGHIRVRNEVSRVIPPPPGLWSFGQHNQLAQQVMNLPSIHAGYLYLARMFCRLVKEATDIAVFLNAENLENTGVFVLQPIKLTNEVELELMKEAKKILSGSWIWMNNILNSLEKQLEVGQNFDTKHYVLRLRKNTHEEEITNLGRPSMTHMYGSSPEEYMIHLLKHDSGEAKDSLPVLDLFSYEHITYILDAYLYTKKMKLFDCNKKYPPTCQSNVQSDANFYGKVFNLLKENDLNKFRQHIDWTKHIANNPSVWLDKSGNHLTSSQSNSFTDDSSEWKRVIDAFTILFLTEGPGYERESFLSAKAGAAGRISRFQRSLAAVRGNSNGGGDQVHISNNQENPSLLMNIDRMRLLDDCMEILMQNMDTHPFGSIRVRFEGEEGTGPGVSRGLFPALANALKEGQKYKDWPIPFFAEYGNLPAQRGIYSPVSGRYKCSDTSLPYFCEPMTEEKRYNAFLALGRFLGLTMWFNQTIPFILSRPVLLFLLNREEEIKFDDLAFFDSLLYDSFSHMINDAFSSSCSEEEFEACYCCYFQISIDGHLEDLIKDGNNYPVRKANTLNYIRLYTKHLLISSRENELLGLREGLQQMVPKDLLETLEPEDLQLILSGGPDDVSYIRLRSLITFSNNRAFSKELLERYKRWFWSIVIKMTPLERQKLLYFATGSAMLPALNNRVGSNEELAISIDIIDTLNSSALPMSSTCGQRISTPLYPSKSILKQKLLQAIECESYGLG